MPSGPCKLRVAVCARSAACSGSRVIPSAASCVALMPQRRYPCPSMRSPESGWNPPSSVAYEGFWTGNYWAFSTNAIPQTILVPSRLVVNSAEAAIIAATAGAGISRALSYQVDDLVKARSLVTLLEAYEPAPMPVTLIYPSQRQVPLKLRAFLDCSIPRLRERLGYKNPIRNAD